MWLKVSWELLFPSECLIPFQVLFLVLSEAFLAFDDSRYRSMSVFLLPLVPAVQQMQIHPASQTPRVKSGRSEGSVFSAGRQRFESQMPAGEAADLSDAP